MPPVHLELKPEAQPYNSRAFPIPQVHYETVKNDVDRLCQLGVLKKVPPGRWACPSFIVPKSNGTVRFITDFRQDNTAYNPLTQTEYLEETGLHAEARSCAGRRGCSQPWDAAVPAGAAVSQHWDVVPCE